jgi:hypothetical protein
MIDNGVFRKKIMISPGCFCSRLTSVNNYVLSRSSIPITNRVSLEVTWWHNRLVNNGGVEDGGDKYRMIM